MPYVVQISIPAPVEETAAPREARPTATSLNGEPKITKRGQKKSPLPPKKPLSLSAASADEKTQSADISYSDSESERSQKDVEEVKDEDLPSSLSQSEIEITSIHEAASSSPYNTVYAPSVMMGRGFPTTDRLKLIVVDLEAKGFRLQVLRAARSYLLICRCSDDDLTYLVDLLKDLGVGTDFGYLNVMYVAATVPPIESVRSEDKAPKRSIQARLPVEVLYNQISGGATISFDFVMNVIIAAMIAATGLAGNSAVSVVASMLVSPMMGPILAFTFATVLRDGELGKRGVIAEILGICICISVGFICGVGFGAFSSSLGWPTAEMSGRGTYPGLAIGALVAFPSGVGVALAVTSTNINSLVGVAISASLLPPLVNCGMTLGYGLLGPFYSKGVNRGVYLLIAQNSFLLFAVNVLCIYVAAILTLKIKAVVPMVEQSVHWEDLPKYHRGRHAHSIPESDHKSAHETISSPRSNDDTLDLANASATVLGDVSMWQWLQRTSVNDDISVALQRGRGSGPATKEDRLATSV